MVVSKFDSKSRIARYIKRIEAEEETLEELAQRVSGGESLMQVCESWGVPYGRFAGWLAGEVGRTERYSTALRLQADLRAGECIPIADNTKVEVVKQKQSDGSEKEVLIFPDNARDRLRIETRLKLAGKWDRGRYGGESEATPPVRLPGEMPILEVARRLAFTLAQGAHLAEKREPRLLEGVSREEPEIVSSEIK